MNIPFIRKWHLFVLVLILLLAGVLFAAPRFAKSYLERHSKEWTGRRITVDRLRIGYFTGTLRVDGLAMYEQDDTTAFFRFSRFRINLDYLPLFRSEIRVASVSLEAPYVQVLQNGERFNFSDLLELGGSDSTAADTAPSEPLKYVIHNIRISGGSVSYTDVPLKNTIALNSLDLSIPGFTWNNTSTKLAVDFRFAEGGGLYADLNLNQADSTYAVNLKLDRLNLSIFEPYALNALNITKLEGLLTNDITIEGSMQHVMQVTVKGSNKVEDFRMDDLQQRPILTWKSLLLDIGSYSLLNNDLTLKSVELTEPYALVELIDSTNNWMYLVKKTAPEGTDSLAASVDSAAPESVFAFDRLVIQGGSVEVTDKSIRVPFDYMVKDIAMEVKPDGKKAGNLKLHVSAAPGGSGRVVTDAAFNLDDFTSMDIRMAISQVHMADFDPYFRHYFGFPVQGGLLNFTTENTLRPASLVTHNKLNMRKFALGDKTGEQAEYHIPLRLAVGVLTDRNGIIDLEASAESRGEDFQVHRLGRIVFRIIGKLFVKAATSPYQLLAGKSGIDPDRLKEMELSLNDAVLTADNLKVLDALAGILTDKPGIQANFCYFARQPEAGDSLSVMLLEEELARVASAFPGHADSIRHYLIEKLSASGKDTTGDLRHLGRRYIGETRLTAVADSVKKLQTASLRDYLIREKQLTPERFTVVEIQNDTIRNAAGINVFRVYFGTSD